MTGPNALDQSDRIPMLLGAGLAGLGSFGVLTAMVDQRHLDFAPGIVSGGYPGLGPSGALMWCAGLLVLSALVFYRLGVDRGLALATSVPCVWLVVQLFGPSEHGWRGLVLGASGWAALAAMRLAAMPKVRRVMVAILVSVLLPLGLRAVLQVGPEHSAMVALWESDREGFLEQRGWAPGGEEAQVFERRLYEAVPTGWFVSPNIFSTVVLGAGLVCLGLSWSNRAWWLAVFGAAWLLILAGSKGGLVAFAIGVSVFFWKQSGRMVPRWAPLTLMFGVVVVVVIRSLLPEGVLAEESLRVRGGYLRGAWQVWQNNPLGVGVDGFQDSYLGVRRAGDAEEVRSAHALVADWLVILGVFALPWMWALARTTFSLRAGNCAPASGFLAGLSAALASALALQVELSSVAGTSALLRVLGVLSAGGVAWCLATGAASVGRGLFAASVAILVHAQLDVTSVTPNAVVWCGLLFAMAAPSMPDRNQWMGVLPAALAVVCVLAARQTIRAAQDLSMLEAAIASQEPPQWIPELHRWPYDPQPRREAVRLGLVSPEGLRSSRQDLQLKSNLVSDPRALHDQLLTLNPYGRALLDRAAQARWEAGDIDGARDLWRRRLAVDDAIRDSARKLSVSKRAEIEDRIAREP